MPGVTREQYEATFDEAVRIVAGYGIQKLDGIEDTTARAGILRGFNYQLVVDCEIDYRTAQRHIARACRRLRHPDFEHPEWGGAR